MARPHRRSRSRLVRYVPLLVLMAVAVLFFEVENFVSHKKTIVGHNLEPTPWHPFPPKLDEESKYARASRIIQCSIVSCRNSLGDDDPRQSRSGFSKKSPECPEFFRWIHRDLKPWAQSGISSTHLKEAQKYAAFRVVIVGGKLYVDFYYACVQSRVMFTVWGLLQLLKRYPGRVPDVDLMFDCMDKPIILRQAHQSMPLPLFRYCTTPNHFDIPFPDWSFWGWPEINIGPWNEEFKSIKKGSRSRSWEQKWPIAFWKGNPDVSSPIRTELLKCNDTEKWRAKIMRQDWSTEVKEGFKKSKLSKQCDHRYKIYAEGYAWSVSLKYIMSCGSLPLIISPEYEDFFSRGLFPKKNYWPVSATNLCNNIKYVVEWGNANMDKAAEIGKGAQDFMGTLNMDRIYDYMLHLITEYSKLLDFEPIPPPNATEVCPDSILCYADETQTKFLQRSAASSSQTPPCTLQPPDNTFFQNWLQRKRQIITDVRNFV